MDEIGAITSYIDVAQIVLYVFWLFFAGLIIYLRMEDKREGYPLESTQQPWQKFGVFFPPYPGPKIFEMDHGEQRSYSSGRRDSRELALEAAAPWEGAPYSPTGDPMLDGVGPASWAERADEPDLTPHGTPKIQPLRAMPDYAPCDRDPDPRGMTVRGLDKEMAGTVTDIWIDAPDMAIRYLEVETRDETPRRVLLPVPFVKIDRARRVVRVSAVTAAQFANVPAHAQDDRVTRLEEDKISAFFGGGRLYATPARMEPLI
mgnify:CR=1 FL=1